jgi:DNA invertase Pin-like site-specific DNA recombinase
MKKAAIYARVSTTDQHVESQLYDLRQLAAQQGLEVVKEYGDKGISGTNSPNGESPRGTARPLAALRDRDGRF